MGADFVRKRSVLLSPKERAIIVLRFLSDDPLTYAELAKVFDTAPHLVQAMESHLLGKLLDNLAHEFPLMDVDEMLRRAAPRDLP